ncbi:MAG: DUF6152 family protein [Acidobacteriota bacterium]
MNTFARTTLAAGTAVAAVLLFLPSVSPAQVRIPQPGNAAASAAEPDDVFNYFAKYDLNSMVTLTGVIGKLDWNNPHVHISLDVRDSAGKVTTWSVEGHGPNALIRTGLPREALKPGEMITITAAKAKDGSNTAGGLEVTLSDGTKKAFGTEKRLGQ